MVSRLQRACLALCSLALVGLSLLLPADARADSGPEKVIFGMYINDIQDITLASNSYIADIYLWLRWRNPKLDPPASIEVMNPYGAKVELAKLYPEPKELADGWLYMAFRGQGAFGTKMDLKRYPFDVQKLTLEFEDSGLDSSQLQFIPDETPVVANPGMTIPGYIVGRAALEVADHQYPTNFGDTSIKSASRYSRVTVTLPVKREVVALAVKIMLPIVIVILLTSLIYVLPARLEEARAGIAVTAMLTLMALQWTVTSNLPDVGYLMMIDLIYILSMVYILVAMAYSVYASRRSLHERDDAAVVRLDRQVGLASLAAYAMLMVLMALVYLS